MLSRLLSRRARRRSDTLPLPIAHADDEHELLCDEHGGVVWPIAAGDVREALEALAEVFGAALEETPARAAETPLRGTGSVVGIGETRGETTLYAHLTGRVPRMVASSAELHDDDLPDVIVTSEPRPDDRLLELLAHAPERDSTTGLIWGADATALLHRVLTCAAAVVLPGPLAYRRIDVLSDIDVPVVDRAGYLQVGSAIEPAALERALELGAGLLGIYAHGDGTTLYSSSKTALCAIDDAPSFADRDAGPACLVDGMCHRLDEPIESARESGRLLHPDAVAARVVVFNTCQGAYVGSHAMDPAWSIFPRLLANPCIGALIATTELSTSSLGDLNRALCEPLAAGVPVGTALAAYAQDEATRRIGHRLMLFGDPHTRAVPEEVDGYDHGPHPPAPSDDVTALPPEPGDQVASDIELLEVVAQYVLDKTRDQATETSRVACRQLDRYRRDPAAAGDFRTALLRHIGTMRARPENAWTLLALHYEALGQAPCVHCGWPGRPMRVTLESGQRRSLVHCARCVCVEDAPSPGRVGLSIEFPTIHLTGDLPERDWSAACYAVPSDPRKARTFMWPTEPAGRPAARFVVPASELPDGPLTVRVVLIAGTAITALGTVGRGVSRGG